MADKTLIGADVTYYWLDSKDQHRDSYISFGKWNDGDDTDSFGVRDDNILFYANGIEDVRKMMVSDGLRDFVVVEFTPVWVEAVTITVFLRNDELKAIELALTAFREGYVETEFKTSGLQRIYDEAVKAGTE